MKLYLDNIIFAWNDIGGISVVWYELVSRILKNHRADVDAVFLEYPEGINNVRRRILDIGDHSVINQKRLPITRYLPVSIKESEPFIFHSSYFRVCRNKKAINITTVHDFTYEKNPKVSRLPNIKRIIHSLQKKNAVKHSDYIICISENTKKDLLEFYPWVDPKKVVVIYNGVSELFHKIENCDSLNSVPFEKGTFLLYVGGRAKYKNFRLVVEYLKKSDSKLVVVGSPFNEDELSMVADVKDRIYHVGRVSDEELNILYNTAFALVYPSAYEGFGIPILEAQKAGCPVIAYNASSIPEVIGDTSLLMKEDSVECLSHWVKQYEDADFRESAIKKGFENANGFSWEKMANDVYSLYSRAIKEAKL